MDLFCMTAYLDKFNEVHLIRVSTKKGYGLVVFWTKTRAPDIIPIPVLKNSVICTHSHGLNTEMSREEQILKAHYWCSLS